VRGGPPSEGGGPMSDKEIKSYLSFAAGRQRTGARGGCVSRTPLGQWSNSEQKAKKISVPTPPPPVESFVVCMDGKPCLWEG